MTTFPQVVRIPPIKWAVKSVFSVYLAMIRAEDIKYAFVKRKERQFIAESIQHFVYTHYIQQFHISAVAENQICLLLQAIEHHMKYDKGCLLFALQMGLTNKNVQPELDPADSHFILSLIKCLATSGELGGDVSIDGIDHTLLPPPAFASASKSVFSNLGNNARESNSKSMLGPKGAEFSGEILRSNAEAATRALFEKWFPDKGEDCSMKISAMPSARRDVRYIDIHDYLEISVEQWKSVRSIWEDHLEFLFTHYCCVYHLLHPLIFYNDQGSIGRDVTLLLTSRAPPGEVKKRIVPYIDRISAAARVNEIPRATKKEMTEGKSHQCFLILIDVVVIIISIIRIFHYVEI